MMTAIAAVMDTCVKATALTEGDVVLNTVVDDVE